MDAFHANNHPCVYGVHLQSMRSVVALCALIACLAWPHTLVADTGIGNNNNGPGCSLMFLVNYGVGNGASTCGPDWYFSSYTTAPATPLPSTAYNNNVASVGEYVAVADPNLNTTWCLAIPTVAQTAIASNVGGSIDWWSPLTNTIGTAATAFLDSGEPTGSGGFHNAMQCGPLGFGDYMLIADAFATFSSGGTNVNQTATNSPVSGSSVVFNVPSTTNVIDGMQLYIMDAQVHNPLNCTVGNHCERATVASHVANTSITFSTTAQNHTLPLIQTVGVPNGILQCLQQQANKQGCQPFKLAQPGQTPATVANSTTYMMPGNLSEGSATVIGNETCWIGQVQAGTMLISGSTGAICYQAVTATTGYFISNCVSGTCTTFPTAGSDCTSNAQLCYEPYTDQPAINGATNVNAEFPITIRAPTNSYGDIQMACTAVCNGASTTTTVRLNNVTCNVVFNQDSNATWDATDEANFLAAFPTNCGSVGGHTWTAINPVNDCLGGFTLVKCTAVELTDNQDPNGIATQIAVTACGTNITCSTFDSRASNSRHFVNGSEVKLRAGNVLIALGTDIAGISETQSSAAGATGYGMYITCFSTLFAFTVAANAATTPITDCSGNNSFSIGPSGTTMNTLDTVDARAGGGAQSFGFTCSATPCAVSKYAIPAPPGMLAAGAEPFVFNTSNEMNYSTAKAVDTTILSCAGDSTSGHTCGPSGSGATNICSPCTVVPASFTGINYTNTLLKFDCKTVTTSPCEEVQVSSLTPATSFQVTFANAHTIGTGTIDGPHPAMCAQFPKVEQVASNTLLFAYMGCAAAGAPATLTPQLVAFTFNTITGTSSNLKVITTSTATASGGVGCLAKAADGIIYAGYTVGTGAQWGGSAGASAFVVSSADNGVTWSAPTQLTNTGSGGSFGAAGGSCTEDPFARRFDFSLLAPTVTTNGASWSLYDYYLP
jgi:hypothetical protein